MCRHSGSCMPYLAVLEISNCPLARQGLNLLGYAKSQKGAPGQSEFPQNKFVINVFLMVLNVHYKSINQRNNGPVNAHLISGPDIRVTGRFGPESFRPRVVSALGRFGLGRCGLGRFGPGSFRPNSVGRFGIFFLNYQACYRRSTKYTSG